MEVISQSSKIPVRVVQDKAVDEALKALGLLEGMLKWLLQSAQAGNAPDAEASHREPLQNVDAAAATPEAQPTPEVCDGHTAIPSGVLQCHRL